MLDFPNSPTNGQQYNAPNGVMYIYSTANGLWMASGASTSSSTINATPPLNPYIGQLWWSPDLGQLFIFYFDGNSSQWVPATTSVAQQATAPGDFFATVGSTYTPNTTPAAIVFNTVKTGNAGGWFNTANGRFTPPAGRYFIFCTATFIDQSATVSSGALDLRKNGAGGYAYSSVTISGNQYQAAVTVSGTFDANGTDYFEIYGSQTAVAMNCPPSQIWFGAYPVGVISYTTPAPGNLYLYSEQVLAANATTIDVTIPAAARLVDLDWYLLNAGGVADQPLLRPMISGVPNATATLVSTQTYSQGTTVAASTPAAAASYWLGGSFTVSKGNARMHGNGNIGYAVNSGAPASVGPMNINISLIAQTTVSGVTGYRLQNNSGTQFQPGSFLRCYVVQ